MSASSSSSYAFRIDFDSSLGFDSMEINSSLVDDTVDSCKHSFDVIKETIVKNLEDVGINVDIDDIDLYPTKRSHVFKCAIKKYVYSS